MPTQNDPLSLLRLSLVTAVLALTSACASKAVSEGGPVFGYASYDAALADLSQQRGAVTETVGVWTVIRVERTQTRWTFSTPGHPAHPTVHRRIVTEEGGSKVVDSETYCLAAPAECDKIEIKFRQIDRVLEVREETGG